MIPAISQITTLPSEFADDVRGYAEVGCSAIEVWFTKLETFMERHSVDAVRELAKQEQVKLGAAALQGGLLVAQGDARREAFALFERRVELCAALEIPTLVVAADFTGEPTLTDFERAIVSLKQAAQLSSPRGVRIALEFHSGAPFCNNLATARALIEQSAEPNLGICLDVFHFYTGPSKFEDLESIGADRLFHVQLCDLAGVPRELATDSDRVLPGDGDFQLQPIVQYLESIGYAGYVSVELMNPRIWQLKPIQVAEVSITSLRKLLGQAAQ